MQTSRSFQLLDILRWDTREWLTVLVFTGLINLLMLTPTIYMLQIYDRVVVSGSLLSLLAISLVVLFLFGVMAAADWFRSRLLVRVGQLIDQRLAPEVFRAAYSDRLRGRSATATEHLADLTQVRQFLTGSGFLNLLDMPWIPVYVAVLFLLHPIIGVFALCVALLQAGQIYLSHVSSKKRVENSHESTKTAEKLTAQLGRVREVIVTMGGKKAVSLKWAGVQSESREAQDKALAQQAGWGAFSKWQRYTQQSAALGLGALLAIRGEISIGAMIAASVLTTRALAPMDGWLQVSSAGLSARAALRRLKRLTADLNGSTQGFAPWSGSSQISSTGVAVELAAVEVRVDARPSPIITGIDLQLRQGQITVIQGASASGKTTLLRVILGVQQVTRGTIQVSDKLINAPHSVGYLPQAIELFDGTVAQNIARFSEPDGQAVVYAARLVGLHEAIQRFERGYDSPVGPGGQYLSGGQRQRIGLARAFYETPSLIVLDEPNSQLESAAESDLYRALLSLKASGSCIVLASHRPGAAAIADQVVEMQEGMNISVSHPLTVSAASSVN